MTRRKWMSAAALVLTTVAVATFTVAQSTTVRFGTEMAGTALEDDKVLIALPLKNMGTTAASDVMINNITLGSFTRTKPVSLPQSVGTVNPNTDVVLQLGFLSAGMTAGLPYRLSIQGTYRLPSGALQGFQVNRTIYRPQADTGDLTSLSVDLQPQVADGATFPPDPRGFRPDEANEEEPSPPVPEGKQIGNNTPDSGETRDLVDLGNRIGAAKDGRLLAANDPVSFYRTGTQNVQNNINNLLPWDPSGATADIVVNDVTRRIVLLTGNTYALLSTNGGSTFTTLDPTTIFPNGADGGLCCDQVIQYVPSINRFIWFMQFRRGPGTNTNRIRIASASPLQVFNSGATSWTYWDMTSATFNLGNNWMDYPDMSYTNSFLHISIDRVNLGLFVIRIPLTEIRDSVTIHLRYTDPANGGVPYGGHLTQDSPDRAYWYGHPTTSSTRIFRWLDSSNSYSWATINVNSWNNSNYATNGPNGVDWLNFGFGRAAIRGATHRGSASIAGFPARLLKIAWSAGRGNGFAQPYVRMLDIADIDVLGIQVYSKTGESQIWNSNFAFQHPYLTTNSAGEVGISVGFGGTANHATPVVGFVGDSTLYYLNQSTTTINRWGDYSSIRKHPNNPALLSVSNYFLQSQTASGVTGGRVVHQYIQFGRTTF